MNHFDNAILDVGLVQTVATKLYGILNEKFGLQYQNINFVVAQNPGVEVKLLRDNNLAWRLFHHPPHIIDSDQVVNPSALIPLCKFGGKMRGVKTNNFSVPVCSGFQPKLLDGEICYSLKIEKSDDTPFSPGKKNGLPF